MWWGWHPSGHGQQAQKGQGLVWKGWGTPGDPLWSWPFPPPSHHVQLLHGAILQTSRTSSRGSCSSPSFLQQDSKAGKADLAGWQSLPTCDLSLLNWHTFCSIKRSGSWVFLKYVFLADRTAKYHSPQSQGRTITQGYQPLVFRPQQLPIRRRKIENYKTEVLC